MAEIKSAGAIIMIETNKGVVHPWLCDVMGHMTTRHYTAMFDDASYHLMHACGIIPTQGMGFVDVEFTTKFIAELKVGSLFYIRSGFLKLSNTSFTARHLMFNCDDDSLVSQQKCISVNFDLTTRKAIPLSEDFRNKAQAFMIRLT
jgi:acyl-CoA thioester hydrolase